MMLDKVYCICTYVIHRVWIWLALNNRWTYVLQVGWDLLSIVASVWCFTLTEAAQCGSPTAPTHLIEENLWTQLVHIHSCRHFHHPSMRLAADLFDRVWMHSVSAHWLADPVLPWMGVEFPLETQVRIETCEYAQIQSFHPLCAPLHRYHSRKHVISERR